MNTELYLDTARLGRMCRGARMAELDFVRLVSQLRSSLYFGRFLTDGFCALSFRDRCRFRGLRCWAGVTKFKREFGRFVSQPSRAIFPFSTSQSLIHFAAECLFDAATTVLATDLDWPPYLDALRNVAVQRNASLHIVRLRSMVFDRAAGLSDIVRIMAQAYRAHDCDGLFLSDISYLGIRIPVRQIVDRLTPHTRPFVVVDGAQALGQRPVNIRELNCDLFLARTQKWFSAYHPLRLAFVGRSRSLALIHGVRGKLLRSPHFHDPLLDFTDAIERNEFGTFGETVNLTPLMTAAGALRSLTNSGKLERRWERRRQNAQIVMDYLPTSIPASARVHEDLGSGIVLVPFRWRLCSPGALIAIRRTLHRYHIAARSCPTVNSALPCQTSRCPYNT